MFRRNTIKPRGYPDRRGMGSQSDFLSETFVPSEEHRREQLRMARVLLSTGIPPQQVAASLSLPLDLLQSHTEEQSKSVEVWSGGAPL